MWLDKKETGPSVLKIVHKNNENKYVIYKTEDNNLNDLDQSSGDARFIESGNYKGTTWAKHCIPFQRLKAIIASAQIHCVQQVAYISRISDTNKRDYLQVWFMCICRVAWHFGRVQLDNWLLSWVNCEYKSGAVWSMPKADVKDIWEEIKGRFWLFVGRNEAKSAVLS